MRSGKDYLASLDDGREIHINGERAQDVAHHPAFAGIAATIAALYDQAADPANDMTYIAPETGEPANKVFITPRSREDLAVRREAIQRFAEISHGFAGRSPDHVGAFLGGFASAPTVFDRGERHFGKNVTSWHQRLLSESLYFSYAIIPPQVSRATTASGWEGEFIQVGVKEERDDGIVVRGSQMLATGAAISDHLLVSCIKPLTPDDVDHAVTFVVPVATKGLKLYCRRPYATGQPSSYDYPLSTRYDESDALVVFDDVFIPWSDVFVCRDLGGLRAQFFETAAHMLGNSQAQIRLITKLKFLAGIARKITVVNQIDRIPSVLETLGELAALVASVEGMTLAAEYTAEADQFGVMRPNPEFVYSPMALQAELYPRVLHIVRELAGGGVLQLPSSYQELLDPATKGDMDRYVQSPGYPAPERVKLFKLAWDAVGSEFAGRHLQYEMFYAGAPFVAKGYAYRNFPYNEALAAVDGFLSSYSLEEPS